MNEDKYEEFSEEQKIYQKEKNRWSNWLNSEKIKDVRHSDLQKNNFIKEIKGELGKEILKSGHIPKKIKKNYFTRFKEGIIRIFHQF